MDEHILRGQVAALDEVERDKVAQRLGTGSAPGLDFRDVIAQRRARDRDRAVAFYQQSRDGARKAGMSELDAHAHALFLLWRQARAERLGVSAPTVGADRRAGN